MNPKALNQQQLEQEISRLTALVSLQKTAMEEQQITIKEQQTTLETQQTTIECQQTTIGQLHQQVLLLRQSRFGRKTEKLPNEQQLSLQFDEIETSPLAVTEMPADGTDVDAQTITYTRAKKGQGRKSLPKNLPYIEHIHDLAEEDKRCACGCDLECIGQDVSEQLDIVPQMAFCVRHIRKKYACKAGCQDIVKRAALPEQPLPKSIASPGLLASIIDSKFNLALPLYRQEAMLTEAGVPVTRATLSAWLIRCAQHLLPLAKLMKAHLEDYDIAYADETTLQVLRQPNKAATAKSYMWLFIGGAPENRVFLYQYHPSRGHDIPRDFLEDFTGYLHADAYAAYTTLGQAGRITHVACMAHARRYFADLVKTGSGKKGLAHAMIALFAKLYALEKQLKEHKATPQQKYQARLEQAKPVLDTIKTTAQTASLKTPAQSALGKALSYLLNHWTALNHYLLDGRLEIDNNLSERAIKPFVIGRKNWLFHGNEQGAKAGALFYSFIATCKYHHIDPFSWFKYVFTHIHHAHTIEQLEQLLPFNIDPKCLDDMRRIPELTFPGKEALN